MIQLALEIPHVLLPQLAEYVDIHFVLAHKVLSDNAYADFFLTREDGKTVILDNSTHEFGQPLAMRELRKAAAMCDADVVIAPDIVNPDIDIHQYVRNTSWMVNACTELGRYFDIAAVLCGLDARQREWFIDDCVRNKVTTLCFTFHDLRRLEWFGEFTDHALFDRISNIHILGMHSVDELREWVRLSEVFSTKTFSFDTSKPLKFGFQKQLLWDVVDLRGGPIRSKEVLNLKRVDDAQLSVIKENISYLKTICAGG